MRVLFICSGNNPHFGTAPFIISQAISLRKAGIDVDIYTLKGKGLKGYLSNVRPLRRFIASNNYDVLHAHYTFCGWIARIAAPFYPLVVSYMGSDTYGSVDHRGKMRLKSIPMILQGIALNLFANALIVKSPNLLKMIVLKKRASVIPNGVDFDVFKPLPMVETRHKLGLAEDGRYVLFAGNPDDPRKNFDLARRVVEVCSGEIELTLLTPYPVKHQDMPLWFNAADLLISTSWLEGSSNVIKEAIACNCPVVATPTGDSEWLLKNINGGYVADYDPDKLAVCIIEVIRSDRKCDGREIRSDLNSSVIAEKIIDIYKKVLQKKG